jgi:lipopolysaccharide transport system ATP-binding protein
MTALAIRALGLGKEYRLRDRPRYDTLRDAIAGALSRRSAATIHRRSTIASDSGRIWALSDVSFDVEAGQRVGVIGANGAGKSTLLKVLSRITRPTTGEALVNGRVGSLLDVGTGFHPELTGRENVYLSGALLGMKRAEIDRRFDEIVSFAEVEQFLETPVKHYSDGMQLRLAFAVAAHLEAEILLVDEVLAVGDARFQRKCVRRMSDIATGEGRTILFVSHNMSAIQRLCDRALLLENGRLADVGATPGVVARYLREQTRPSVPDQWIDVSMLPRRGTGEARFRSLRYTSGNPDAGLQPYPDGPVVFTFEVESDGPRVVSSFGVVFVDRRGTRLVNADILTLGQELHLSNGRNLVRFRIEQLHLHAGVYDLTLWLGDTVGRGSDVIEAALQVEVVGLEQAGFGVTPTAEFGSVTCEISFESL